MDSLTIFSYGEIRTTEDFRYSVYDTIEILGDKKNPHDAWSAICERYPEVISLTSSFQFPGRGQRETPVATQEVMNEIIRLLPTVEKKIQGKIVLKRSENYYRSRLSAKSKGKTEVCTPAGRIDILTSDEIIEVKHVNAWKSALGQIEVYGDYYPSHQKRIHLFGDCHENYLQIIRQHCGKRNITVTWEV